MRTLILVLLTAFPILTQAQSSQHLIDSLLQIMPHQKEDTNKAKLLNRLSAIYCRIDAAKGIEVGLQGADLAKRLNFPRGFANVMINLGLCYVTKVEYEKALACFDTAYTVSEKISYQRGMLLALMNDAVVYNQQGYYPRAIDGLMRSLKIAEEIHDSMNIALNLMNIGTIYNKIEDYQKGLEYIQQAYPYYKRTGDKNKQAIATSALGDTYEGLGQRAKAIESYSQALILFRQLGDRAGLISCLANRAIAYSEDKNYEPSIKDFSEAARVADSLGDSYRLASVLDNFAHTYIDAAQAVPGELPDRRALYLKEAQQTLIQALVINKKNGNLDALSDNYKYISLLDSVNGNYKEALKAYEQYRFYNDSIFTTHNEKTIQKLEDQRQIDLRDKQIQINNIDMRSQRNQRWFLIAGLLVLFLIGALLLFQSRQRKKANQKLLLLNTQLDEANRAKATLFGIIGHDLRSPVASLVNYLHLKNEAPDLTEEDQEKKITAGARSLLATMEELLLWGKGQMHNFTPRKEKLTVHDLFADIRLLYPDADHLQIQFLDPQQLELFTDSNYLKTILRNLTSNAIKAVRLQPQGLIVWRAWQTDGHTRLSITDNGRGITEASKRILLEQTALNSSNGLGLHLVRDFAAAIGATVNAETLTEGGTVFILEMPSES